MLSTMGIWELENERLCGINWQLKAKFASQGALLVALSEVLIRSTPAYYKFSSGYGV